MAAKIAVVTPDVPFIWKPEGIERLWFFPDASEYLRYSPHFHVIHYGGFRQNLPLTHMFVAVLEGKLSVKDFWGNTKHRVVVQEQVWGMRGSVFTPTPRLYAMTIPGRSAYVRSGRRR